MNLEKALSMLSAEELSLYHNSGYYFIHDNTRLPLALQIFVVESTLDGLKELLNLANVNKVESETTGICRNLERILSPIYNSLNLRWYFSMVDDITSSSFKLCEHYSGSVVYPIPAFIGCKDSEEAICSYNTEPNMWTGRYGKARIAMLTESIVHVEEMKNSLWSEYNAK